VKAQARGRKLLLWLGLGVSASAIAWLAHSYDGSGLMRSLASVRYSALLPAVLLVIIDYLLRALRWRALLAGEGASFGKVFRALMLGYLFNVLLPARAGELVRAHRLGVDAGIARAKVLGTVVAERTGDLAVLVALLVLVFVAYPALPSWLKHAGSMLSLLGLGALATLVGLAVGGERVASLQHAVMRRVVGQRVADRLQVPLQTFVHGCTTLLKPATGVVFVLVTGLLWFVELAIAHQVALAFDLHIAPGNLLFVLLVIAAGTMIPSSPGFVGTYEFFGTAALGMIGIKGPEALSFVVVLHALALLVPSMLGSLCLITLAGSPDQAHPHSG
jgi:uncharacterized protein (TIRG00374 family)